VVVISQFSIAVDALWVAKVYSEFSIHSSYS
jgi:hypothetical protein